MIQKYNVNQFSYEMDLTLILSLIENFSSLGKLMFKLRKYKHLFTYSDYYSLTKEHYLYPQTLSESKKCIFCHKQEPEVSFKTKPHVIPELLGNHYLLHYEECDSCNNFFGITIEDALDKFLKPYRTLNRIESKKSKLTTTYSIDQKRSFKFDISQNTFIFNVLEHEYKFHENENVMSISFELHKHRPSDVYKCMMKILFGLLPREHLKNFEIMREWIINPDPVAKFVEPLQVYKTYQSNFYQKPLQIIILYREALSWNDFKNNPVESESFEYLGLICFGNVVFEVPIITDLSLKKAAHLKELNKKYSMTFHFMPKLEDFRSPIPVDLTSSIKVENKETIYFDYQTKT